MTKRPSKEELERALQKAAKEGLVELTEQDAKHEAQITIRDRRRRQRKSKN